MELPKLNYTPIVYRIALGCLFFNQGIVFATWAGRIADVKVKLNLNEAELGGILFALPLGQVCAMALSGYLVTKFGSRIITLIAGIFYPAILVALAFANSATALFATLMAFGVAANMNNISINTLRLQSGNRHFDTLWSGIYQWYPELLLYNR